MELKDLFLGPIYFFLILCFAFIYKVRVKDTVLKKYFMPALVLKLLGAIALGMIYQFYYEGGDTFTYFTDGSQYIWNAFLESPTLGFKLLFQEAGKHQADTATYASRIFFFPNEAAYFIVRVSAFFGFLSFHTYIVNAMLFAVLSFTGVWKIYLVFYKLYPHLHRRLAIGILFFPSLIFWGSGILKDSVSLGALGWFFYGFYNFFITKKNKGQSIFIMIVAVFVLKVVKVYIILCFIPAAAVWLFLHYNDRIKSKNTRILLKPVFLVFAISMGLFTAFKISKDNAQYQIENIQNTAKSTAEWIQYSSTPGSSYTLGDTDFSVGGMVRKMPQAIWVSLFRPYIWEAKNVVMLISSLENFFVLLLTFFTIKKVGFFKSIDIIKNNSIIFFSLVFALTFGLGVGMSTYNFGSLARYKIPLLPFYITAIFLIRDASQQEKLMRKNKRNLILNQA